VGIHRRHVGTGGVSGSPLIVATALRDWHTNFAWVVVVANGLAGAWVLAANWIEPLRVKSMWWFVIAAELTLFVQVTLGVAIVAGEDIEAPQFHMLYGFAALITVAIIYSYRQQVSDQLYLLYGLGGLFLMGLAIRAMFITA
jgi:hypothetical protein